MSRLIPLAEEIQATRREIDEQKGRQKSADFYAERGRTDTEGHPPESEQGRVLQAVLLELLSHIGQVAPFLRRHRDPLDAAAARKERHGNADQPQSDPDAPPVFFAKQFAPGRAPAQRLTMGSVGDFRHGMTPANDV